MTRIQSKSLGHLDLGASNLFGFWNLKFGIDS
jgi:hypothetical protein